MQDSPADNNTPKDIAIKDNNQELEDPYFDVPTFMQEEDELLQYGTLSDNEHEQYMTSDITLPDRTTTSFRFN